MKSKYGSRIWNIQSAILDNVTVNLIIILYLNCYSKVRKPCLCAAVGDFGFIGIHVKPEDAVNEIQKLADVYESMASMWSLEVMSYNPCKKQSAISRIARNTNFRLKKGFKKIVYSLASRTSNHEVCSPLIRLRGCEIRVRVMDGVSLDLSVTCLRKPVFIQKYPGQPRRSFLRR